MRKPRAIESLRDHLKGRDRLAAIALERAGLVPRVVPYVFETCAGDSWRLRRDVSAREKQMFAQKRLKGSALERKLPIEFHADCDQSDDVTWLVRPPWVSTYREPADGRPEPAVELLGQTEYSATDYFGNEASDVSFYAAAAILFDGPPTSARTRRRRIVGHVEADDLHAARRVGSTGCTAPATTNTGTLSPRRWLHSRWQRAARREMGRAPAPRARPRRRW